MTNRELQNIIEQIKKREKTDLTGIATSVGKDRSYLSKLINSEEEKEITKALLRDFKVAYPSYFAEDNKNNASRNGNGTTTLPGHMTIQDHIAIIEARRLEAVARAEEIKAMYNAVQKEKGVLYDIIKENLTQLMANSNKHLAYLEKILLVDRADHETTMDSLDRIEHQPVGSNSRRAGKRELDASKNLRKKDKKSQGGVSK